ncbi:MAG TPA: hypothetical protein VG245_03640 [Candidatus Dormibacteraeota bacterium]|jgi:hypothetical protein|nr:hypothetical protein [Candidatus Dormibacteraeota bacterium]
MATPEATWQQSARAFALAYARAVAWTLVLCLIAGGIASLVAQNTAFLYFALGLGVVLEVAAGLAMLLDSVGAPGGLIVGTVLFFPVSMIALAYLFFFRQDLVDEWFARRREGRR